MSMHPDDLTIRRARDGDLPDMARIHFAAYPGLPLTLEERIDHFKDDPRLPLEDNWVCERNGRLIGTFALYNFSMYRSGSVYPAGGIGRVAVAPEGRLEKIAYYLMERAVQIMDQNGVPLSILYPFRHSYYRKLGWGIAEQVRFYRISPESIPVFAERAGMAPIRESSEYEDVMSCYHRFADGSNGLLVRSEPVWYEHVLKNNLAYSYRPDDEGDVEGYIIYRYRPHSSTEAFMVSDLIVREMLWTSERGFRGILGFLSAQRDQVRSVEYYDHYNLPLEHLLKDPRMVNGKQNMTLGAETAWIGSGLMGRIIQLRRIFTTVKFGKGDGTVTFRIKDELNTANSAPLTVEFENGRAEIKRRASAGLCLNTDIATFSSIFWGALSLREAVYLGKVELEGSEDSSFLYSVLSFPRSICLDYF